MKTIVVLLGLSILLVHGVTQEQMPRNVDEAVAFFEKQWTEKQKQDFKNKSENDAVTELHFSVGLWIRNNWVHGDRNKSLNAYFHKLGVPSADDVSSIILTSLHRKLNGKPIDLQKQVGECKAAWKPILVCEKRVREHVAQTYHRFKVGNAVTIRMYVDVMSDGTRNAVTFSCPTTDWKFDAKKDLMIQGKIVQKYTFGSDSNAFFKVRINKMNFPNTEVLMKEVKVGGDTDFSLINLEVK